MNKNVVISMSGLHNTGGDDENIELVVAGTYYNKNGKHYLIYEESDDDGLNLHKNTIKVTDKTVELIKNGGSDFYLFFEENRKSSSYYKTPYGTFAMDVTTTGLQIDSRQDSMDIEIRYALAINYEHTSDCMMSIKVKESNG